MLIDDEQAKIGVLAGLMSLIVLTRVINRKFWRPVRIFDGAQGDGMYVNKEWCVFVIAC